MEISLNNIYKFLTYQDNVAHKCSLIKRSEKLFDKYDYSFPINLKIWKRFEDSEQDISSEVNILNCKRKNLSNEEILEELVQLSKSWDVSLRNAEILNDKCFLYLDRQKMFSSLIPEILNHPENYGKEAKDELESVHLKLDNPEDPETVTEYRTFLVSNVLKNLLKYSRYTLTDNKETAKHKFLISTKSNKKKDESLDSTKVILCGVVTDPKNGKKLAGISAEEYKKKRANDVLLMASHKYGLRAKNEKIFVDLIQRLGAYAVTVDFLEIKVLSPVGLNYNFSGMGCSKGASFILYNSARLETLIDNFDRKVKEGYYPALPDFKDIDISLLKEEEEWQLLFHYIFTFPDLIKRCLSDLLDGKVYLHTICSYLAGLVGVFSVYYRRVRLLTENRAQLLPVLFAKIYLLKCLQIVFNKTLSLLDIEPVKFM